MYPKLYYPTLGGAGQIRYVHKQVAGSLEQTAPAAPPSRKVARQPGQQLHPQWEARAGTTRPATWGPSPRTASGTCASPDTTCPPTLQVESGPAASASWRHRLGHRRPEVYVRVAANQPHVTCIFCIVVTIIVQAIH
jgi:hypothetical protein